MVAAPAAGGPGRVDCEHHQLGRVPAAPALPGGRPVRRQLVRVLPLGDATLLKCDDACPPSQLLDALHDAVRPQVRSLRGGSVVVDIGRRSLTADELAALEQAVLELLQPRVLQIVHGDEGGEALRQEAAVPRQAGEEAAPQGPEARAPHPGAHAGLGALPGPGQAYVVRRTVRSGQRITCDASLVVVGDVNPGAELVAAGDIIVLGALRGVAHAGARGDEGAVIAALRLVPVQLRIGQVIGRAPDARPPARGAGWRPERARVQGGAIVVEPLLGGDERPGRVG